MRAFRLASTLALTLIASGAFAQSTLLNSGPTSPGRVPMYVGSGSQPVVQDSGPAGGGGPGLGLKELLIVKRGTGTPPFANQGSGPLLTSSCMYDAPITNATGYHFLCFDPNAQGGGLIAYGAGGIASQLPLNMSINGTTYTFPFAISGIVGPGSTTVGAPARWNNTVGTLLDEGPVNLSLYASGTLLAAQFPALTGDVTNAAGSLATSIANGAVTFAKIQAVAANTTLCNSTGSPATLQACNAATMRGPNVLNIDQLSSNGDSNAAIAATTRTMVTSAALTAPRTWTLPAANALNAGQGLYVTDLAGGVSATNTLTVQRAGSDTVNGTTGVTISTTRGGAWFISDGVSAWSAQLFGSEIRTKLTQATDYYVTTGGSDANPCTVVLPCRQPQRASDLLQQTVDVSCQAVRINLADGSYAPLLVKGPYVGDCSNVSFVGRPNITITGVSTATPMVVTAPNHGFTNGMHVVVSGVQGIPEANGAWVAQSVTTNTFALTTELSGANSVGFRTYTSGGVVSAPSQVVIAGTSGSAIRGEGYAQFNVQGVGVTALSSVCIQAFDARVFTTGPVDLGQCGSAQAFGTRAGYLEFGHNYSISGGSAANMTQCSHRGEVRFTAEGYFRASVNYGAGGGEFLFADYGDCVVTTSTSLPPPQATITGATNASPIVITATAHPFHNGDAVAISGVSGNLAANGTWFVANATANTFELATTTGSGAYGGGGQALLVVRGVTGATNASPIVITAANHGFSNGDYALIRNVVGNTAANGAWVVSSATANTFALTGSTGNGAYVSGGTATLPGVGWNKQGFAVPASGTLRQYRASQNSNIQVYGTFPAPANFVPGTSGGLAGIGQSTTAGPNVLLTPGSGVTIQGDTGAGVLFQNANASLNTMQVDDKGHVTFGQTAPTLSACGGSPSVVTGSDSAGTFVTGSATTTCTLTFAQTYTSSLVCTANAGDATALTITPAIGSPSTLVVANGGGLASKAIYYVCQGH